MNCAVVVCDRVGGYASSSWCSGHYNRNLLRKEMDTPIRYKRPQGNGWRTVRGYWKYRRDGQEIYLHRAVMEELLGRPLAAHEHVHHKDGDKLNNDWSNLELWVNRVQPAGQRDAHCMTCSCHEGGRT